MTRGILEGEIDFVMDKDEVMTEELLMYFIERHQLLVPRYEELYNQYITRPPIMREPRKQEWKPDNRIPVNFGRYIVDTFNGFFSGVPLRVTHEEEGIDWFIKEFWRNNSMDNVINETAKMTSIYGHAFWYLYQNEESETEIAYNDPRDMFVVYSDEIRPRSMYGVRYVEVNNEEGVDYKGVLFSEDEEVEFYVGEGDVVFGEEKPLYYGRVPLIEVIENEERLSLITPVEVMINSYNEALSEKKNDISYFSNAFLKIIGKKMDEEDVKNLLTSEFINIYGKDSDNLEIDYLEKPNADGTQENFLDRVERKIYETSMVVNLNDDQLGNSNVSSGEALKRKEQPMSNMAVNKERKYNHSLLTLFKMLFNLRTNVPPQDKEEYRNINFKWSRNLPSNKVNDADYVKKLEGIVSRKTQIELLPDIEDVDEEVRRIELEEGKLEEEVVELEEGKEEV